MPSLVTDQLGDIFTNADRRRTLGEKFFGGCLEERRAYFIEECRRDVDSPFNVLRTNRGEHPVPPMSRGMYIFPESILEVFLTGWKQNQEMEEAQRILNDEGAEHVAPLNLAESSV
eukprot:9137242-Alexandrium_andersonii.AAC.1